MSWKSFIGGEKMEKKKKKKKKNPKKKLKNKRFKLIN
jgi:hypothetical protein